MADFFAWDDSKFKFNIQQMDLEHKEIVRLINKLYAAHSQGADKSQVESSLMDLYHYTVKHFQDEEKYFDSIGFPGSDSHKIIHQQMLQKLQEYAGQFKAAGSLSQTFFDFLSFWLTSHILGIDTKYAQHAKQTKAI